MSLFKKRMQEMRKNITGSATPLKIEKKETAQAPPVKHRAYSREELETVGGRYWSKDDRERIYFDRQTLGKLAGLEFSTNNSGSIQNATLNGEKISNNHARQILDDLDSYPSMFYDLKSGKFNGTPSANKHVDKLHAGLEKSFSSKVEAAVTPEGKVKLTPKEYAQKVIAENKKRHEERYGAEERKYQEVLDYAREHPDAPLGGRDKAKHIVEHENDDVYTGLYRELFLEEDYKAVKKLKREEAKKNEMMRVKQEAEAEKQAKIAAEKKAREDAINAELVEKERKRQEKLAADKIAEETYNTHTAEREQRIKKIEDRLKNMPREDAAAYRDTLNRAKWEIDQLAPHDAVGAVTLHEKDIYNDKEYLSALSDLAELEGDLDVYDKFKAKAQKPLRDLQAKLDASIEKTAKANDKDLKGVHDDMVALRGELDDMIASGKGTFSTVNDKAEKAIKAADEALIDLGYKKDRPKVTAEVQPDGKVSVSRSGGSSSSGKRGGGGGKGSGRNAYWGAVQEHRDAGESEAAAQKHGAEDMKHKQKTQPNKYGEHGEPKRAQKIKRKPQQKGSGKVAPNKYTGGDSVVKLRRNPETGKIEAVIE